MADKKITAMSDTELDAIEQNAIGCIDDEEHGVCGAFETQLITEVRRLRAENESLKRDLDAASEALDAAYLDR